MRIQTWLTAGLAAGLACGGSDSTGNPASIVRLTSIASGLDAPLFLTTAPGDATRLFVVEKTGRIRVISNGDLLPAPFLDLSAVVSSDNERGLLGLAFHPGYAANGRFFVHYNDLNGETRISEFGVSADPDVADPGESLILGVDQPATDTHKGGMLAFGPDGYLYVALGDGAEFSGTAQDLSLLLGKLLRIDINGGSPYAIPADNPFVAMAGAAPEIWSYGLRNPWRFSFDRQNGDLYIGDVGENRFEEVDVAPAATGRGAGANFGWDIMEASSCYSPPCSTVGLTLPVLQYGRSRGCTVVGGYVYRGAAIPAIRGFYFYADYCQGWVRSFRYSNGAALEVSNWPGLDRNLQLASFGEDAVGELYLIDLGGEIFRIDPS